MWKTPRQPPEHQARQHLATPQQRSASKPSAGHVRIDAISPVRNSIILAVLGSPFIEYCVSECNTHFSSYLNWWPMMHLDFKLTKLQVTTSLTAVLILDLRCMVDDPVLTMIFQL